MPTPIRLFISYAHEDEVYKEQLEKRLKPYIRSGVIQSWNDRAIIPGAEWDEEIRNAMNDANIILFLISSDFLASDYIHDIELTKSMERYEKGEVKIIPIILRSSDLSQLKISQFQALPKNAMPISKWEDKDDAWMSVISGLKKLFDEPKDVVIISEATESINSIEFESVEKPGLTPEQKTNVKQLIAQSNLKAVFTFLQENSDLLEAETNTGILMLSSQFNRLSKESRMNIISSEEAQQRSAKIIYGLLEFIG